MATDDRTRFPVVAAVAALVLVVAVAAIVLLYRGDAGDDRADAAAGERIDMDVLAFERRIRSELGDLTLRPHRALRVRAGRVVWNDGSGAPFVRAPSMTFTVETGAGGSVLIRNGIVEEPVVDVVQYADGSWSYESILDPLLDPRGGAGTNGSAGAERTVTLLDIRVRNGRFDLSQPELRFGMRAVDARLTRGRLSGPGVAEPILELASADAVLLLPDSLGLDADGNPAPATLEREVSIADATLRLIDGAVAFRIGSGQFASSTFASAVGVWNPEFGGLGLDAELTVTDLRLADVPWLQAEVPEGAGGSFLMRIEPRPGDASAIALSSIDVSAPGSAATGSLRAFLGPAGLRLENVDLRVDPLSLDLVETFTGPLPYVGQLRGTIRGTGGRIRYDLLARLATSVVSDTFETRIAGDVSFTDAGITVGAVDATFDRVPLSALKAIAPGLPLDGMISGSISLSGPPTEAPATVDIRLEAGGGIITTTGTIDLSGAVPAYDLRGRIAGVELRRVLEPSAPPVQVHANYELEGSGLDPATANAALRANGGFTGWRTELGDTLAVRLSLAGGTLDARSLRIDMGPIELSASGQWALEAGTGAIDYELDVASLEPLSPYLPADTTGIPLFARGSLSASGRVAGSLDAPVLTGTATAADFRYGEWAAETFAAEYDIRAAGDGLPRIVVEAGGTEIRTPSADFDRATLDVDFTRPEFSASLVADQAGDGGILELEAAGLIEEMGGREVSLSRMEVDLENQRWSLPSPALIAWNRGGAVRVEGLSLAQADGPGLLRVDGTIAPADATDFDVEIRSLPVEDVLTLIGSGMPVDGRLDLSGSVSGIGGTPDLSASFTLVEGAIRGVAVRSIEATLDYDGTALALDGVGLLGDSARIEIEGRVPADLQLGVPPAITLIDDAPISARLSTSDFPLSTLDPGLSVVRELEGLLNAELRVSGTPADPELGGTATLAGGSMLVPLLEQRYTGMEGTVRLSGREARVERLVANSGGTATVTGTVRLESLTNPVLDLTAQFDEFRPQGADDANDAGVWGTLRLTGSVASPVVTGDVYAADGTFDLAPFLGGAAFNERLVGVGESFQFDESMDMESGDAAPSGLVVRNLAVDLRDDLFFATEEARIQLSGELIIYRAADETTVQGTLSGTRGTFGIRVGPAVRRFQIVESNIRFFGTPDPDPAVSITATRAVRTPSGGDLDVRANVSGTLSNPALSLTTGAGAAIPDADLLSYIIFGESSASLGQFDLTGGGNVFQSDALALLGIYDQLGLLSEDLADEAGLGLDYFRILPGEESFFGGVQIGRQLFDEVMLIVEQPFGTQQNLTEVSLEWRIDRQWTLDASWGPVQELRLLRGRSTLPADLLTDRSQLFIAIRRRWTY